MFFKFVETGYVVMVGRCVIGEQISEDEYLRIMDVIRNKPIPRNGYDYMLRDITYEWEEVPIPEPDEPTLTKGRGKTVEELEKENIELREQLDKLTAKK